MGWDGLILTDSGGFQVFSLLATSRLDEEGVTFRSPVDGPRAAPRAARGRGRSSALDSDVAMVFDHAPRCRRAGAAGGGRRAHHALAAAARARHAERSQRGQALFGIVQGGLDDELRARFGAPAGD
jgi:queuine tRNA-ribosyltransferase